MRKIWLILAALLLACCVTAALAEDGVDLDALVSEIDAGAEDLKGLTDGIYLINNLMNEAFFTTSDYTNFERKNEIINYQALKEKYGGEPTVTCTSTGGAVEFNVYFYEETYYNPAGGYVGADLVCNGERNTEIPHSAAGVYDACVTVTWGDLSASFPIRANVMDYTGPALNGLSGIPDTVTLSMGEAWDVEARPDPADWSYPGMWVEWGGCSCSDDSLCNSIHSHRVDDSHIKITFERSGTYEMNISFCVRYRYNGIEKPVFSLRKDVMVTVWNTRMTSRIELTDLAMSRTLFNRYDSYFGETYILNYYELRDALGDLPTASVVSTGKAIDFEADVYERYVGVYIIARFDVMDGDPIPQNLAGEYSTVVNVQWGDLTAQLPVSVIIKPYEGPELRGISGLPDTIELAVGEVWHIEAKPDPVDWAWPGFYLTAGYTGVSPADIVINGCEECPGDASFDVSFRKTGEFDFDVNLRATDAEDNWLTTVCHTVHVTVLDKPVPNMPTQPPAEPTDPPAQPLAITETQAVYEISPDKKSIFIDKPTITGGAAPYTIAYNCYDAESNPVNYYYSDDARTAMSPGYNGRFNVFVVVRDSAGGQAQIDTGWQDLSGYGPLPLSVLEEVAVSEISPDGRSIFINQPTVSGGTGNYTFAYNCYDAQSQPVNYYYSNDARTAMTPGYAGHFCVFVVVSDGNESIIINTGWYDLKE